MRVGIRLNERNMGSRKRLGICVMSDVEIDNETTVGL